MTNMIGLEPGGVCATFYGQVCGVMRYYVWMKRGVAWRVHLYGCVCSLFWARNICSRMKKRIGPTCSYLKSKNHLGRKTCYKLGP